MNEEGNDKNTHREREREREREADAGLAKQWEHKSLYTVNVQ